MNSIIKLIEQILGKTLEPNLLAQIQKVQIEQEMQKQMPLQQQQIFLTPRRLGNTALAQMAGCTPPGTVQRMQAQQLPYKHQDIMEEYERYIAQMVGVQEPQEPEEVVMEFSLLEE